MLEKIINYLEHQMSSTERADFERELASNDALKQETELLRETLFAVEAFGDEKLRQNLQEIQAKIEKEEIQKTKKKAIVFPISKAFYWAVAASFLGIFFCIWFFGQKKDLDTLVIPTTQSQIDTITKHKEPTIITEKNVLKNGEITPKESKKIDVSAQEMQLKYAKYLAIAEENYSNTTSSAFSIERSAEENPEQTAIDSVLFLLKQKKYQNAIFLLEKSSFSSKYDAKIKVLKAHSYFLAKQYEKSRTFFKTLIDNGKTMYQEEADFYLSLCYLADYQHFKNDFEQLSSKILNDKEHSFYEKTLRLKEEME